MLDTHNHISSAFNNELADLNNNLLEMGGTIEVQFKSTIDCIIKRDEAIANLIISKDKEVDNHERTAINQIQLLIAKRQPVGVDLRMLVGCTRIAGYLERTGDLLSSIAKRSIILIEHTKLEEEEELINLAKQAEELFKESLNSFSDKDFEKAEIVRTKDIEIDKTFTHFFSSLLKKMSEKSKLVVPGTHMLFMAKNFERIGDHATNISESISYMANGEISKETRPKYS